MVINLRRIKRWRADETGRRWPISNHSDIRKSRDKRVFLNDVEVTHRCFYVDGRRGIVRLFDVYENGSKFLINGDIAWHEYRGRVKVVRTKVAA